MLWEQYNKFRYNDARLGKIDAITKQAIIALIDQTMKECGRWYYITDNEKSIMLSIRSGEDFQINIPVYFDAFRETIRNIPDSIRRLEETARQLRSTASIEPFYPDADWKRL